MKYVLKWSGRENSEVNQLAFEYCKKQIPICKDVCEFIDHDRYLQLIAAEEIEGPTKYSGINQFEIGMIALSGYADEYRQSWENLGMCYKDFVAGYEACNKKLKFQLDWDEAIIEDKAISELRKVKTRTLKIKTKMQVDTEELCNYYSQHVSTRQLRNGYTNVIITAICTGYEFENFVTNFRHDTGI